MHTRYTPHTHTHLRARHTYRYIQIHTDTHRYIQIQTYIHTPQAPRRHTHTHTHTPLSTCPSNLTCGIEWGPNWPSSAQGARECPPFPTDGSSDKLNARTKKTQNEIWTRHRTRDRPKLGMIPSQMLTKRYSLPSCYAHDSHRQASPWYLCFFGCLSFEMDEQIKDLILLLRDYAWLWLANSLSSLNNVTSKRESGERQSRIMHDTEEARQHSWPPPLMLNPPRDWDVTAATRSATKAPKPPYHQDAREAMSQMAHLIPMKPVHGTWSSGLAIVASWHLCDHVHSVIASLRHLHFNGQ